MRFVFLFILFLLVTGASSQTHVVQRGETYEVIASRYGITEKELLLANPDADCVVGMELVIPFKRNIGKILYSSAVDKKWMQLADDYFNQGKYKKAEAYLSKSLAMRPSVNAYWKRGLSYFEREKYEEAINDFTSALICEECTESQKKRLEKKIEKATSLQRKKEERRNAVWNAIGQSVVQTAVTITSYQASKNRGFSQTENGNVTPSLLGMSNSDFQNYSNQQLNSLFQASVQQVQEQEWQEYQQTAYYHKKATGEDLSYSDYQSVKAKAVQNMKDQGIDIQHFWKEEGDNERLASDRESRSSQTHNDEKNNSTTPPLLNEKKEKESLSSKQNAGEQFNDNSRGNEYKKQFHDGYVSSSEYSFVKKITLYYRDGNSAKVRLQNVDLCRKEGHLYVLIGNKYYVAFPQGWNGFKHSIVYSSISLYF